MNKLPGIEAVQEKIIEGIFAPVGPVPQKQLEGILWEISKVDEEMAVLAFGKLGKRLRDFALVVDKDHPDLQSVFDGELAPDGAISKRFCEILRLCQHAKEQGMTEVFPHLSKASSYALPKELKSIDDPRRVNRWIRLLRSEKFKARETKQPQEVFVDRRRLSQMWDAVPDDFGMFMRYDEQYRNEMKIAEEQARRYEELGCPSNAKVIREEIEKFGNRFSHCYHGFHRITVMEAALILAKMHGAKLALDKLRLGSSEPPYVEFDQFSSWGLKKFVRAGISPRELRKGEAGYKPMVYPAHSVPVPSDKMVEVLDYLEGYPGLNRRSLFDHALVVWPEVDLSTHFKLYERQDERVWDVFQRECYDHLVQQRELVPVLLGERDGKCYFICYWM